jgi:hypothetical protein
VVVKPSPKVALFLKSEVHAWWLNILARRDAEHRNALQTEMARAAETDAESHARLISQITEADARRDDKPRKGGAGISGSRTAKRWAMVAAAASSLSNTP